MIIYVMNGGVRVVDRRQHTVRSIPVPFRMYKRTLNTFVIYDINSDI